jgi:type IV pilus assembly protein PilV
MTHTITLNNGQTQSGAFLLEALIAILIFSFGILGIVGLQAKAIRFTNDAEYRAEATYLANSLISEMWADDFSTLQTNYDSVVGTGLPYNNFKTRIASAMAGVTIKDPVVEVNTADLLLNKTTKCGSVVQVTIFWRMPGEEVENRDVNFWHNYTTSGVVGQNLEGTSKCP